MKKTYKIYTLGCKVNQYDSGRLAADLERAGLVKVEKNADLAIINSCAVTQTAAAKSRRAVKLAKKENPKAKVILAGCLAKLEGKKSNFKIPQPKKIAALNGKIVKNNRARYFIKIQDGCEQFCSYCIVPYVRGKLTSRAETEILAEIKSAANAGFGEIVLSGIHLGLYGKDLNVKNGLIKLIKKIIKIKNLGRIRLSSVEITEVDDEIIKFMRARSASSGQAGKVCKHLAIPLQSGSDKILKLMRRPYDKKYFAEKINRLRRALPDLAITTDVIVGFPGETEKDFRETENFIKKIKFSRLHVFPFSAQPRTPAAKLPGQVSEAEKNRRVEILRKLGVKLERAYAAKFKGKKLAVAVEQARGEKIIGKTEYYFNVEVAKKNIKNQEVKIGQLISL